MEGFKRSPVYVYFSYDVFSVNVYFIQVCHGEFTLLGTIILILTLKP